MLELKHICYDVDTDRPDKARRILSDVSLGFPKGTVTVITGHNGSGKSTLIKLIMGIDKPTSGRILFNGEDITDASVTERALKGMTIAFQQPVRFKGLAVKDLLELAAGEKMPEGNMCDILGEVRLCAKDYINRDVDASLSGGESKRIEIATVLARKNVRILVFDEPEAGIDLWSFAGLIDAFQRIKSRHSEALLIISHQERILEIADKIVVIADGKIRTEGNKDEVLPQLLSGEKGARCPLGKDRKEVPVNE